ncbi:MAG: aspartate carbamoyltransferase catalytic subunit [Lysobacterales bacterium]
MSTSQVSASDEHRHLLTLEGMSRAGIEAILDTAAAIASATAGRMKTLPILRGHTVVNLFFEPSTRTRTSFELAARRLSAEVVNFDVASSSASKGESLLDTLRTLAAMRCDLFVVRHRDNGAPAALATALGDAVAIVNAGDGSHAHPTQGLLDVYTIRERFGPDFSKLRVLIVGDVAHSRVARSDIHALLALGVGELRVCGPPSLRPASLDPRVSFADDIESALADIDVVMLLRLQKERMQTAHIPDDAAFFETWGLTDARLALARPNALVMHPGPINREVEIASSVADGAQSAILTQVANGLPIRMAVMCRLLGATLRS